MRKLSSKLSWESTLQESLLIEGAIVTVAATRSICSVSSLLEGIVTRGRERSTVAIGRDYIAEIATLNQFVIYNGDPTWSVKIVYFKWSTIKEDAKDRTLIRSYVLGCDFDNHVFNLSWWDAQFFDMMFAYAVRVSREL